MTTPIRTALAEQESPRHPIALGVVIPTLSLPGAKVRAAQASAAAVEKQGA